MTNKVSDLLDTSSTASSSVTGSLSSSMPKRKTDQESNNSTQVPAYKAATMEVMKAPDIISVHDNQSEVIDSIEIECKKYLKKKLTESGDDCGIIVYFDVDGDVQMNIIGEKDLEHLMTKMIADTMKDMNINKA